MPERKPREEDLPPATVQLLRSRNVITRNTSTTQEILQCALCPLATEPFYAGRKCSPQIYTSRVRITQRLRDGAILINRRLMDSLTNGVPRVVYDVDQEIKDSVPAPQPLPGCIFKRNN